MVVLGSIVLGIISAIFVMLGSSRSNPAVLRGPLGFYPVILMVPGIK